MARTAPTKDYLQRLSILLTGAFPTSSPTTEKDAVATALASTAPPVRPAYLRDDRHRHLVDLLAQLPLDQRRVLVLRYFGDHSDSQISTLLRMPRTEVASHAQRAIAKLRSTAIPSRDRSPRDPQTLLSELRSDEFWNLAPVAEPIAAVTRSRRWLLAIPAVAIVAIAGVVASGALTPESSVAERPVVTLSAEVADSGELVINDRGTTVSEFPTLAAAELDGNASTPWAVLQSAEATANVTIVYVSPAEPAEKCGAPLGVHVTETDASVTIAVVSSPPTGSADCVTNARYAGGTVYLSTALGTRELVHAGLSDPWSSLDSPIATSPRPVEPTAEPIVYQDEIYLTSEGMGDLRLGKKIPDDTELVFAFGDSCSGWLTSPPFDVSVRDVSVFSIEVTNPRQDSPLKSITIVSPEIPTKSGARVGDSEAELKARFPDLGDPVVQMTDQAIYAISGTAGKVLFSVGADSVLNTMQLVPVDAPVPYVTGSGCGA
jgi:hypothetical protein